jgi:hypothetical protein
MRANPGCLETSVGATAADRNGMKCNPNPFRGEAVAEVRGHAPRIKNALHDAADCGDSQRPHVAHVILRSVSRELLMPLLVRLLMLTLACLQSQTVPVSSDTAKRPRFRDEANRLSFAYPAGLHLVISPAEDLRASGAG